MSDLCSSVSHIIQFYYENTNDHPVTMGVPYLLNCVLVELNFDEMICNQIYVHYLKFK